MEFKLVEKVELGLDCAFCVVGLVFIFNNGLGNNNATILFVLSVILEIQRILRWFKDDRADKKDQNDRAYLKGVVLSAIKQARQEEFMSPKKRRVKDEN